MVWAAQSASYGAEAHQVGFHARGIIREQLGEGVAILARGDQDEKVCVARAFEIAQHFAGRLALRV